MSRRGEARRTRYGNAVADNRPSAGISSETRADQRPYSASRSTGANDLRLLNPAEPVQASRCLGILSKVFDEFRIVRLRLAQNLFRVIEGRGVQVRLEIEPFLKPRLKSPEKRHDLRRIPRKRSVATLKLGSVV